MNHVYFLFVTGYVQQAITLQKHSVKNVMLFLGSGLAQGRQVPPYMCCRVLVWRCII